MDMAVAGAGKPSVPNVLQRNTYWEHIALIVRNFLSGMWMMPS